MDRNLLLAFALSFLVLMLWSLTQEPPRRPPEGAGGQAPVAQEPEAPPPEPEGPLVSDPIPGERAEPRAEAPPPPEAGREARTLSVENNLYRARFSSLGAGLVHHELSHYQVSRQDPSPVVVTTGVPPHETALLTPFRELGLGDLSAAVFEVERESDREIAFAFSRDGITVRKVYRFDPDSYAFRLRVELENGSGSPVEPRFAVLWPAHHKEDYDFKEQGLAALHEGEVSREMLAGLGTGGFLGMFSSGPPQTVYPFASPVEWAGMETTYFLAAILPDDPGRAVAAFEALEPGRTALAQVAFPPTPIPAGHRADREFKVYVGPKVPERLEAIGSNLDLAINEGWSWFSPLTRFFGWLLHQIHVFVPNYGWSIIILTILVRLVTAPLTVKQMRSMERMRAVQPKLKEIQAKHADDRQKQSEAMMALYRQEKVNPLGGCLPMVLQLPVFIGLFYALRSSIQLRQAGFFGWIDDLSAPESLFEIPGLGIPVRVLPLIMGATMVVQQRLTPMQGGIDPAQQRMMMTIMPIVMTVVFYQFASGLVLYWMVSNVLAILHQLWIGRRMRTPA